MTSNIGSHELRVTSGSDPRQYKSNLRAPEYDIIMTSSCNIGTHELIVLSGSDPRQYKSNLRAPEYDVKYW